MADGGVRRRRGKRATPTPAYSSWRPAGTTGREKFRWRAKRRSTKRDPIEISKMLPDACIGAVSAAMRDSSGNVISISDRISDLKNTSTLMSFSSVTKSSIRNSYICPKPCCQYQTKILDDEEQLAFGVSPSVLSFTKRIHQAKRRRADLETLEKLDLIKERVMMALEHSGLGGAITSEINYGSDDVVSSANPVDLRKERKKIDERQKISSMLSVFSSCLANKEILLKELEQWFSSFKEDDAGSDEEEEDSFTDPSEVKQTINQLRFYLERLDKIGASVFEKIKQRPKKPSSTKKKGDSKVEDSTKKVIGEQALADLPTFISANKNVISALDDLSKSQSSNSKHLVHYCASQQKLIWNIMQKKLKDLAQLDKELQLKVAALSHAKEANEKLLREALNREASPMERHSAKRTIKQRRSAAPSDASVRLEPGESSTELPLIAVDDTLDDEQLFQDPSEKDREKVRLSPRGKSPVTPNVSRQSSLLQCSVASQIDLSELYGLDWEKNQGEKSARELEQLTEYKEVIQLQASRISMLEEQLYTIATAEEIENAHIQVTRTPEDQEEKDGQVDSASISVPSKPETQSQPEEKKNLEIDLRKYLRVMRTNIQHIKEERLLLKRQQEAKVPCSELPRTTQPALVIKQAKGKRLEDKEKSGEVDSVASKQQLLVKVRNQYENELQLLREQMAKEQERYHEEIRKTQMIHKRDIQMVHEDRMEMLKMFEKFKMDIGRLLARESLHKEAAEVRRIHVIPADYYASKETNDWSMDQILRTVCEETSDALNSLEAKISDALMSKGMEIQRNKDSKKFMVENLEIQVKSLQKTAVEGVIQNQKLKVYAESQSKMKEKYQALMENYEGLQSEVKAYQKLGEEHAQLKNKYEILRIQAAKVEEMRKSAEEKIKKAKYHTGSGKDLKMLMRITQAKHFFEEEMQNKSLPIPKFFLSKNDQKENLKILEEAHANDQITDEEMKEARDVIQLSMDLPRMRFINFVKRYVNFTRLKTSKDFMTNYASKCCPDKQKQAYLEQLDIRFKQIKADWNRRSNELGRLRFKVYEQYRRMADKIGDLYGILLLKPYGIESREQKSRQGREKNMTPLRPSPGELPECIEGKNILDQASIPSYWQKETPKTDSLVDLSIPALLDMDIHRFERAAQCFMKGDTRELPPQPFPYLNLRGISRKPGFRLTLPPIATMYPD